jgi:hypothetical protein
MRWHLDNISPDMSVLIGFVKIAAQFCPFVANHGLRPRLVQSAFHSNWKSKKHGPGSLLSHGFQDLPAFHNPRLQDEQ